MSAGFVHLHVHSEYSVLDGACKVQALMARCKEYGMSACALTDHGCMFGVLDFFQAAKEAEVKPIIGCELYVAPGNRFEKAARNAGSAYYHLVLLCKDETGYHNLCRLSSLGYTEGFHFRPRVDLDLLEKYKEGLIATSACLGGEIPRHLMNDDREAADAAAQRYIDIFGKEDFIVELQDHGMPEQQKVNPMLVDLAQRHGLLTIAANDCHYTDKADAEAHEALLAVQTNALLTDEKRFKFPTQEFYFTSPDEMRERFAQWPESVSNTELVAERCNVELPLGQHLIPEYIPPDGMEKAAYLKQLVMLGLEDRYDGTIPPEHVERAEFELGVIEQMGFVDYFLVVWDLINYARSQGIPVGPGRGSGAGSLVAFALQITNIDPMRYGLLFERFLNPERVSMPDFDLDFCYNRRGEVIEYVREKYGAENVSQIITFGRMLAKQVLRNMARVLGMPYAEADRLAKMVPDELKITLKSALEKSADLQQAVKEDEQVARLWELATRLEGTIGNCGTHAAGVVICDQPLTDHVPLFQAAGSDVVATQFEMKGVEEVGLLKMDFLGLRTLTVVHDAVRFIRENKGIDIDIDAIEPNDEKTYELLRSGETSGVFQLESSGMRELSKRIGLESLEEICALVALYRPGPMALKDQYIESKYHPERIKYDHPLLEPILSETYGVALYQEQVMQIVQAVARFSLGQADILRRAMGKKKVKLMEQQRAKFIEGCLANDIDKKTAELLFSRIEQFAGYGFNKSHSMAYAFVAYQTAFLKTNYPVEFMAALLTSESGDLDKVGMYVEECRRLGIEVLPPDVNSSCAQFTPVEDGIRFGLGAVKNVGEGPIEAIVSERDENGPFTDVFDLCSRVDTRSINQRVLESLNKAGALASTGWNRRQVDDVLSTAISQGQLDQKEREAGQTSLLDLMGCDETSATLHEKPDVPEWPENEILAYEKEMLGLYVSSHPLARYAQTFERYATIGAREVGSLRDGQEVVIGGMIGHVKEHITKRGTMAFITLDTLDGSCEVTAFSDVYEPNKADIVADAIVMVSAKVSVRNGEPGLLAAEVVPIDETEARLTRAVHVRLDGVGPDDAVLEQLALALGQRQGSCDVYLHCFAHGSGEVTIHASSACCVAATEKLREEVIPLVGEGNLWFSGGNGHPTHNGRG